MINENHGEQFHTTWPPCKRIVQPLEPYKEQYGNFPNLVKNCPFALQASIYSHVPKSSSQKGCMNFSLISVFSKYTANSDFPTPLKLCPFSTTSTKHLFKNSTRLCRRTGKEQVPRCSCLRSPSRIRITRCRTLFWAKKQGPQAIPRASQHTRNTRKIASTQWRNFKAKVTDAPKLSVIFQEVKRSTLSLFWTIFI